MFAAVLRWLWINRRWWWKKNNKTSSQFHVRIDWTCCERRRTWTLLDVFLLLPPAEGLNISLRRTMSMIAWRNKLKPRTFNDEKSSSSIRWFVYRISFVTWTQNEACNWWIWPSTSWSAASSCNACTHGCNVRRCNCLCFYAFIIISQQHTRSN